MQFLWLGDLGTTLMVMDVFGWLTAISFCRLLLMALIIKYLEGIRSIVAGLMCSIYMGQPCFENGLRITRSPNES